MSNLILILGDQLSRNLSALENVSKDNDEILMMEVLEESTYVKHHKKKLVFILSAMRHFAKSLTENGFKVHYIKLTDKESRSSFTETLIEFIRARSSQAKSYTRLISTEASEYRVLEMQKSWVNLLNEFNLGLELREDLRFFCTKDEFRDWAKGKKSLIMENFYREMRKKNNILIDNKKKPIGGKWNYDHDNRETLNDKKLLALPERFNPEIDEITKDVISLVEEKFSDYFGDIEPFYFAVTERDARKCLEIFLKDFLVNFGKYQDAMLENEAFIYHSILSQYINIGLLDPSEICKLAESEYFKGSAPINAVEGFIRQILGWREFIRGIYWLYMPDYVNSNSLQAYKQLPEFYWEPEKADMNCLKQVIKQTKENAYSHHIQRLMLTGNFALIAGLNPREVHEWYLSVYADAYEWVELPNTVGMALYADAGKLATKPYAASGAYINKMSNFCKNCKYDVKEKTSENACPFNYLYWDFIHRNAAELKANHRLAFAYKNLENFDEEKLALIKKRSKEFLEKI